MNCPLQSKRQTTRAVAVLAFIVLLFAIRNVPWHLDDLDQAKQAFVSFEMIEKSQWVYQHTPIGRVATKPPLAGWIAAGIYHATGRTSWEVAWRLPSFLCALGILWGMWRVGTRLAGSSLGGLLAAAAFGLNTFTPRLATLVRTDAIVGCCVFLIGAILLRKAEGEPWRTRDRVWVAFIVFISLMAKGPICYVFLLPGLVAFWLIQRKRGHPANIWPGWTALFLPLAGLAVWAWFGMQKVPGFYDQVIAKEFLGRVSIGAGAAHHPSLPGRYTLELIWKWAPWSLLLAGMLTLRRVRAALRHEPQLLWLACWAAGGLLAMECVPSKRFDRIFPAIAPMCLLIAGLTRHAADARIFKLPFPRAATLALVLAALASGTYATVNVVRGFRDNQRVLVDFGRSVRRLAEPRLDRLAVVNRKREGDEGLLLYIGITKFANLNDALGRWRTGKLDWLVLWWEHFEEHRGELGDCEVKLDTGNNPEKGRYVLLGRRSGPSPGMVAASYRSE